MSAMRVVSLYYARWLSVSLEFMQQWLPGFAEVESPISVDVIWMHLNFDGFSEKPSKFFIHLPLKMEPKEGSETLAFRTQTPGNYPKENILHKEHGGSLKSRNLNLMCG